MIRTEVYSKKKYRRIQTENQEKKREKVALGQSTEDVWTPTPTFSTRDKRLKALFTNLSIDSLKYDLLISSFSLCNYTIIFVFHQLFACCRQWMSTFFLQLKSESLIGSHQFPVNLRVHLNILSHIWQSYICVQQSLFAHC